jgi:hypothetical protein
MKNGFKTALLGIALISAFNARAQEGQNINNRYGPPNYTGGTVNSPSQYYAAYQQQRRQVQEATLVASVFPNPANSTASVVLGDMAISPVELYVVNMNGAIMQSHAYNAGGNRLDFDVSNLPNGLYSIQVQERGKSMQCIKLLKQE